MPRRTRRAVATGLLAVPLMLAARRRRGNGRRPGWPPPADAVTSDGAEAATAAFAARGGARPHDAALDFAWSTAASIDPWVEGENFFPRIFADIESATHSVHILMFGWREGEVGMRMAALLERKLAEGVEVRMIVDSFGSRPYKQASEMFTRLAAAGAEIVVNDVFPVDRRRPLPRQQPRRLAPGRGRAGRPSQALRDRRDDRVDGGAGIEDHFENGGFHDVMVRVTGDVVRQAQAAFLTSFRGHGGPMPDDLGPLFPAPAEPRYDADSPRAGHPRWVRAASQAIREQLDGARTRLDVMNPYLTDREVIERLLAAAASRRAGAGRRLRGVEQRAGDGGAQHRYDDMIARWNRALGAARHRRPRKGRRGRRRRLLRHGQLRRVGALPQLGDHDDGQERRGRGTDGGAVVRARHRALEAAASRPRERRERLKSWLWERLTKVL